MAFTTDPATEGQLVATGPAADEDIGEPARKRSRSHAETSSGGDAPTNNDHADGVGPADKTRLYSCGKCSKSYARLDHLSRHVRMHTQEKPYQCQGETVHFLHVKRTFLLCYHQGRQLLFIWTVLQA